jgi:hypothetical protein
MGFSQEKDAPQINVLLLGSIPLEELFSRV